MPSNFKAPADLAQLIDPLKEFFTWKWVAVTVVTFLMLFTEFTSFCASVIFGYYSLTIFIVLMAVATIALYLHYAMTPQKLEENLDGVFFEGRIKKGIDTFSKWSPKVKKWVVKNFTGIEEFDEETGLCKEKCNKELY